MEFQKLTKRERRDEKTFLFSFFKILSFYNISKIVDTLVINVVASRYLIYGYHCFLNILIAFIFLALHISTHCR